MEALQVSETKAALKKMCFLAENVVQAVQA